MHAHLQLAELVASIPSLLGFHPVGSLILAAFRPEPGGRGRFLFLARVDLPDVGEAAECISSCMPPLERERDAEVLAVVWEASPASSAADVLDLLPVILADSGIPLLARLVVSESRLRHFGCSSPCCKVGTALPRVPRLIAVREPAPEASRQALAALLQPGALAECVGEAAERIGVVTPAQTFAAWALILRSANVSAVETDDLARAIVGIGDPTARDALIASLIPGTVPPECFPPAIQQDASVLSGLGPVREWSARLVEFSALVPPRFAAAPLTVCGALFWGAGDGARARVCLDRALGADPSYRLARLLVAMVELGISPQFAKA